MALSYFDAEPDGPNEVQQLTVSDGTVSGTQVVASFIDTGAPLDLTTIGSRLFYIFAPDAPQEELWTSDGTAAGTFLLQDFALNSVADQLGELTNVDGILYFRSMTRRAANCGSRTGPRPEPCWSRTLALA
jgi:ELWxxDGT repeat protein